MATWEIPTGKEITGSTYIKDTDNNIADTMTDLVAFVNGTTPYSAATGLSATMVDLTTAQTIAGIKTFSDKPIFSSGITGDVTGNADTSTLLRAGTDRNLLDAALPNTGGTVTGQVKGITPVSDEDLTRKDYVDAMQATWTIKWSGDSASVSNTWGDGVYLLYATTGEGYVVGARGANAIYGGANPYATHATYGVTLLRYARHINSIFYIVSNGTALSNINITSIYKLGY